MDYRETYKGKKIYKSTGSRPWVVVYYWSKDDYNLEHFSSLRKAKAFIDKIDAERK